MTMASRIATLASARSSLRTSSAALLHSSFLGSRCASSLALAAEKPDYYRVLGVRRDANPEQIKTAFREQAKIHHPDVLARKGATEGDLAVFKAINEAYTILSDPAQRREYDNERGWGSGTSVRGPSLRQRNEGIYGGSNPVEGPKSSFEGGEAWSTGLKGEGLRSGASADGGTSEGGSSSSFPSGSFSEADRQEALRISMARAAEKQKDGVRFRAALARMQRSKVEVPPQSRAWTALAMPAAVAGIWVLNWALFMK